MPQIFESGGTTGAPKRTAQLPDWVEQVVEWQTEDFTVGGFVPGGGFLCLMPSGPHGVGYFSRRICERLGSVFHPIDLDPRWVKKLAARNAAAEVAAYVDHVLEQARWILRTQSVANMHTTPPLLEAIARNDADVDLVNEKIRYLLLSGAHVDVDTLDLLRDIFPATTITMAFGSTMILSQATTRETDGEAFVFDPRTPYVVFWVVDPDTGEHGAVRRARPGGDEPHQQGHVHPQQPRTRQRDPDGRPRRADRRLGQRGHAGRDVRGRGRHRGRVLIAIDALGPAGEYRSRNREVITDTAGVPVAELSIAPKLYVARAIGAQRKIQPLPVPQREAALAEAAEVFRDAVVCGLDFEAYVQLASRVSGCRSHRHGTEPTTSPTA